MNRHRVCIIIPTLNEARTIGKVLAGRPRQALEEAGFEVEVMLIDGNSTDGTSQIAEEMGG